jgi:antitoxin component YwqK of YwqJK toxin-antitoxin module
MKKALGLGLLCVLVGCSDPTGGGKLTITKHDNGKTASRGFLLNDDIKVGAWIYFYEDGLTLMKHGRYVNGQMHGQWSFLMPDATSSWTAEYKHGEGSRNGLTTTFAGNGKKLEQGIYRQDVKEGVWTSWDDKGNVTKTETYKNGKLVK